MPKQFFNKGKLSTTIDSEGYESLGRLDIKLFGQWEETIRVLQKVSPAVKEVSIKAQLRVGREIVRRVKAHLRNQDLGWQPLSSSYQKRKADAGLPSGKILYAYGNYYRNIEVWRRANHHLVYIGVRRGRYTKNLEGKKSKIDIATIAAIHELSSGKRIPKRPLWNPTIKEMGGVKGIKTLYVQYLVKGLQRKGIPIKIKKNVI